MASRPWAGRLTMSDVYFVELHDAELIGVEIDRTNERARLTFQLESGHSRLMELAGLKAFRSEDVTSQNVVSRLLRSSRGEIANDHLDRWLSWATSLSDARSWLSEQRKSEWLAACASGNLELVVIEPSAGAQVAAVCERVSLR
jgi:hypothetical protein